MDSALRRARRCRFCSKERRSHTDKPWCWECVKRRQCPVCLRRWIKRPRQWWCAECNAMMQTWNRIMEPLGGKRPPRGLCDRRIAYYAERAALHLPLFVNPPV